jgi:hypothetical protein
MSLIRFKLALDEALYFSKEPPHLTHLPCNNEGDNEDGVDGEDAEDNFKSSTHCGFSSSFRSRPAMRVRNRNEFQLAVGLIQEDGGVADIVGLLHVANEIEHPPEVVSRIRQVHLARQLYALGDKILR